MHVQVRQGLVCNGCQKTFLAPDGGEGTAIGQYRVHVYSCAGKLRVARDDAKRIGRVYI